MSMDGLVVRAIVSELNSCAGARIYKIHQPSEHDLLIQLRSQGANRKLLLSANPTYPRVHFTNQPFVNPLEAPMFCMLLRKHCENGVLEKAEQAGMERIIHLHVRSRDELGDLSLKTIVVELMGRHSNIILLDPANGTILDGIHHVTPAISRYRIVLPGSPYIAPPAQNKLDPLHVGLEECIAAISDNGSQARMRNEAWEKTLVERFTGISPLTAREIVYRAWTDAGRQTDDTEGKAVCTASDVAASLIRVMSHVRNNEFEPVIAADEAKGRSSFSCIRLTHLQGKWTTYETISECLETFFGEKAERDLVKQKAADLVRFLQNERNKNLKKIDKLLEGLEEAKDADRYRVMGELLTAYLHQIRKGDREAELINFYDEAGKTVRIELDPQLTPSENAQRYFRKYTKAKNGAAHMQEQLQSAREEIRYLESLLQQLDHASLDDMEEIREELIEQGYLRARNKAERRKKKNDRPALLCYTSSEGATIYVGKNNKQNDYLTCRLAQANDTWLHTKDIPGSHVVIRGGQFGPATLEEAAQLAAYYSQAKQSSQVPVDYTLIRHVRKPNGAKPGFVIYEHQKTLFVTPDPERIKRLKFEIRT
jgi:predicted ribosome quality control (RQC) complex YloA/Tae2 family protein